MFHIRIHRSKNQHLFYSYSYLAKNSTLMRFDEGIRRTKMTTRRPYSSKPDHSVLRPGIEVANSGMKQAIYAMKCGSKEVNCKKIIDFGKYYVRKVY